MFAQIVESVRDGAKVRQKILRHVGVAMDDDELHQLKAVGEHIKAKLEAEHQPSLFSPEQTAQEIIEAQRVAEAQADALLVDLKMLREQQRVIVGVHEVYGTLFDSLGFDRIIERPKRHHSVVQALRHIVLARIANPDSKRASVAMLEQDFGVSIALEKVYRMMDKLDEAAIDRIKQCALHATQALLAGPLNVMFFDCTTLYFESFTEDELKCNGFSKDAKFNQPQVLLALLVTTEGLAVGYEVFPGATFEGHTLKPVLDELASRYAVNDIIFVADRGLLSQDNLQHLDAHSMNYIVGGKLKTLPKACQQDLLEQRSGLVSGARSHYAFHHKGRRWVVRYNRDRGEKDRHEREKAIERLGKKLAKSSNPKSLLNNYGHKKYLKVEGRSHLSVDLDKVELDAQWDGLQAVVTSLEEASPEELFGHYQGLWQVEESFRITKHDLKVRPIYHWTPQRIRAHLAISFVAFTLVRHLAVRIKLQYKALSPALIRNALLHVQQSVLQHRSTGERYCIPSNPTAHAQKIYQVMGLKLHTTPFKLTANVVQNFTQSPQCSA